jgi:nucleotide-binding universal stress UspA family protein
MNMRPSILCPIDYSEASAGALRYAAAIAEHFLTRLIVLVVEDPMLTTALDLGSGIHWTRETSEQEAAGFVSSVFGEDAAALAMCEYDVAVGKPPVEILRVARERSCDLIVMSSHGVTGARKLFFGSTGELPAHQAGSLIVTTVFLVTIAGFVRRMRLAPDEALFIGIACLLCAITFEFRRGTIPVRAGLESHFSGSHRVSDLRLV